MGKKQNCAHNRRLSPIFCFLFRMTPSAEIISTTHLPQFGGIYFGLKNQYKFVFKYSKKKLFIVYDANKNIKKLNDCIIFCYKKNLQIRFQNGPEHTTSLQVISNKNKNSSLYKIVQNYKQRSYLTTISVFLSSLISPVTNPIEFRLTHLAILVVTA